MLASVKAQFHSCFQVVRFKTKQKQPMGTVKLLFNNPEDLDQAAENRIYIQNICLKLSVERARPKP